MGKICLIFCKIPSYHGNPGDATRQPTKVNKKLEIEDEGIEMEALELNQKNNNS